MVLTRAGKGRKRDLTRARVGGLKGQMYSLPIHTSKGNAHPQKNPPCQGGFGLLGLAWLYLAWQ